MNCGRGFRRRVDAKTGSASNALGALGASTELRVHVGGIESTAGHLALVFVLGSRWDDSHLIVSRAGQQRDPERIFWKWKFHRCAATDLAKDEPAYASHNISSNESEYMEVRYLLPVLAWRDLKYRSGRGSEIGNRKSEAFSECGRVIQNPISKLYKYSSAHPLRSTIYDIFKLHFRSSG